MVPAEHPAVAITPPLWNTQPLPLLFHCRTPQHACVLSSVCDVDCLSLQLIGGTTVSLTQPLCVARLFVNCICSSLGARQEAKTLKR
jgi:hypothetical protein